MASENIPIKVHDCSNLELRIHVLGYYPQGESVLVILWDAYKSKVCISILVDCFEIDENNRFESLLTTYKINTSKLNYLIWTHPDMDHSIGYPAVIKKYVGARTKVFVPYGLRKTVFNIRNYSLSYILKNLKNFPPLVQSFANIFKLARRRQVGVEPVSNSKYTLSPALYGEIIKDDFGETFKFEIEILTPFRDMLFKKTEVNNSIYKNDLSISFNIKIGQYRFFFGGDAEDEALKEIKVSKLKNTIFVKIPHHGSKSSIVLPDIYKRILDSSDYLVPSISAVTTSFYIENSVDLPSEDVLKAYKGSCRGIYMTKSNKDEQVNQYGIWSFTYKYQSRILHSKTSEGDSSIYYELKKGRKK